MKTSKSLWRSPYLRVPLPFQKQADVRENCPEKESLADFNAFRTQRAAPNFNMKQATTKTETFQVQIPNLDGDGIAETVPIEVQVYLDPETGEEVLTQESVNLIEKTQARHMGLMTPEEIKGLRQRLDVTQKEISDLLQVGEKTYTRWENGRSRPSRSMNLLLCALRDGCINVNYLRFLRDPNLKTEWFSRIPDPKRSLASIVEFTLNWNDNLKLQPSSELQRWLEHSTALLAASSANRPNWRHIFISTWGEKWPMLAASKSGIQPRSEQRFSATSYPGRQTRIPLPIRTEAEEEHFG